MNTLFYALMVLSSSLFLFISVWHVATFFRERERLNRRQYVEAMIWTMVPVAIIIGLGILSPYLVANLQQLS